jgi:hypothetical protein
LVQLQAEHIAKLNIQLSRIQNTIDAQFLKSRILSRGYHDLARHLDMDRETKSLALNFAMGFGGKEKMLDLEKIEVRNDLNYWVDYERPCSHEDFLIKRHNFANTSLRKPKLISQQSKITLPIKF